MWIVERGERDALFNALSFDFPARIRDRGKFFFSTTPLLLLEGFLLSLLAHNQTVICSPGKRKNSPPEDAFFSNGIVPSFSQRKIHIF